MSDDGASMEGRDRRRETEAEMPEKVSDGGASMEGRDRRRELEAEMSEMASEAIAAVKKAKHVDQVICALHSLAVLLFPVDSSLLSGVSISRSLFAYNLYMSYNVGKLE